VPQWSKYWIFQVVGWLLFFLFSTYIALLVDEFSLRLVLMNVGISVFGLYITHVYRSIILRKNWQQLPLEKLLNRVVLSIFALTALFAIWYYLLLFVLYNELRQQLNLNKILSSCVSIFILFVLWNTFYFMWSYIENSRKNLIAKLKMESELKELKKYENEIESIKDFFNYGIQYEKLIDDYAKMALLKWGEIPLSNSYRVKIDEEMLVGNYFYLEPDMRSLEN
jgi:hypothetical protein